MNYSSRRKAWRLGDWKVSKGFAVPVCSFYSSLNRETSSHLSILDFGRGDYRYFHKTNSQLLMITPKLELGSFTFPFNGPNWEFLKHEKLQTSETMLIDSQGYMNTNVRNITLHFKSFPLNNYDQEDHKI